MMSTREEAHTYLAERLNLPDYYGKNLDALYDSLAADIDVPTCLVIYHRAAIEESLGKYGKLLLGVMWDAAQESPYLQVTWDGDEA